LWSPRQSGGAIRAVSRTGSRQPAETQPEGRTAAMSAAAAAQTPGARGALQAAPAVAAAVAAAAGAGPRGGAVGMATGWRGRTSTTGCKGSNAAEQRAQLATARCRSALELWLPLLFVAGRASCRAGGGPLPVDGPLPALLAA
jgi:hypothetical protein